MTLNALDWDLLRSFLAVLKDGSQSEAARALGLAQPTIGRRLETLETALGFALFTRSPRGLMPTPAALELAPYVEAMAAAAAAFARKASGAVEDESGAVRVTASQFMSSEALPPILAQFRRDHPGMTIELDATNRMQDLLRRDADIAVRMARSKQDALITRKIGVIEVGLFAHRDYVEHFGLPKTPDDLRRHRFIGYDRDDSSTRGLDLPRDAYNSNSFCFRSDDDLVQLAALRAGVGIGGCQIAIGARSPELVPILPDSVRFTLEMWLAMHEDLKTTRRVRLMFDALAEGLGRYVRNG